MNELHFFIRGGGFITVTTVDDHGGVEKLELVDGPNEKDPMI